eukprot:CAMPEP_0183293088 /NCGR_PEP_ID=MMETSP0160_2-20130417/1910_1 /TAXON_ID=2839 ORGANISM="Odontella Sinensis, Strain Grunow 1884" /NCGR_SAMPLE_ID=MMETSP0160_2 /ASSEMBLY_ACC=CAM_ASM_000250 /LENGTH=379 /DNA_ID=CAMNT_0025454147 /DNA_START=70 /DNA_END=1209 /DNA_ORIENTATION=+
MTTGTPSTPRLAAFLNLSTESFGLLLQLLSSILLSIMGVFLKLAAATGLPSTEQVFLRAMFQGSLVLALMTSIGCDESGSQGIPGKSLLWFPFGGNPTVRRVVIARGVLGGLGFICYYYTISHLPLGDAFTLLGLHPAITVFAASAILGEPLRKYQVAATMATITGAILISRPTFIFGVSEKSGKYDDGRSSLGYITAFLGACLASGVIILVRKAGKIGAHTFQLVLSWAIFGIFFSLIFSRPLAGTDGGTWGLPSSHAAWGYVFGLCCFGSMAHLLMNYAGRITRAGLISLMKSSEMLWSYLLQVLVFGEAPRPMTLVGAGLILISLVLIGVQKMLDGKSAIESDEKEKDGLMGEVAVENHMKIELHVDYGSAQGTPR